MAKMLNCDLEVNEFEIQSRYYVPSRTNIFGKGISTLFPQLHVKKYHYYSSTMIALTLNNPRKVGTPLNKSTNQPEVLICKTSRNK